MCSSSPRGKFGVEGGDEDASTAPRSRILSMATPCQSFVSLCGFHLGNFGGIATRSIAYGTFRVTLSHLGTFGGQKRGVLWLSPETPGSDDSLFRLHHHLVEAFPICNQDATKHTPFTPHMTLSHFATLDDALVAQQQIEADYADLLPQLEFELDKIYLLRRQGDGGQFLRVAEIGLGKQGRSLIWDPPLAFPNMPVTEEEWVYEERMKLKQRRNKGWKRRSSSKRSPKSRQPRIPDTPEIIAAKRAERKAKRELLTKKDIDDDDSSTTGSTNFPPTS